MEKVNYYKCLVLSCLTFFGFQAMSQTTVNVQTRVTSLYSNVDCSDSWGVGNPDPRWKLWYDYSAGAGAANTAITVSTNFGCGSTYGVDDQSCGSVAYNLSTTEVTNTTNTFVNVAMEAWEEDGCSGDCNYGTGFFCNDDEHHLTKTTIAQIQFRNQPPCAEYNWGLSTSSNRGAEIRVNWSYHTVSPSDIGSITSTPQSFCGSSDPALISSVTPGLPFSSYQWQYSDNNGVLWTDIPGATSASYDPPVISATRWFRRGEIVCQGTSISGSVATTYYSNVHVVNIDLVSVAPTSITPSVTSLCGAGTVDLTAVGGTLGTGAQYEWFDDACGGNLIATTAGPTLSALSVSTTTTFFVRIVGSCNTTTCAQVTVPVTTPSTAATAATASATTVCNGTSVTLSVTGGALGTSSTWEWYSGSCGTGVNVGSGASISVSPAATTTYFVRAEGGCGPTSCQSVTVTVEQVSIAATSVSASPPVFCSGGSSVLSVVGGTLGTGADWVWYEAGCALGTPLGSGTTITVSPTSTTDYYVRAEGSCNNTACTMVTVTVNQSGSDPTSIAATGVNICPGQTSVLSVVGGTLGTGATWEWYSGSCGGTSVGSGNTISVAPTSNTTYFVRAEGTCGNSACASVLISVGVGAADPTAATVINDNICPGDTAQVFVTGGVLPTGYTWVWYTGACGAIPVGIGDTITVTPNSTTTYYVRATGTCGNTNCTSATVTVVPGSVAASGVLSDNNNFCPGESAVLTVDGGSLVAGAQWTWYENSCGGTPVGTGPSITVTPSSSTSYYVRAEGGACGNTICQSISINVLSAYAYMVPFDNKCGIGEVIMLDNGIPTGGTYTGTGVSGGVFDPSVAGEGIHTITYNYTETNGCTVSVSSDIEITASTILASAIPVVESCSEGGVTIVATASGGSGNYTFVWSDGSTGNPLTYASEGIYSLVVKDTEGCATTVSNIAIDETLACIEVANTFTPNGDGTNDTWNLDFSSYSNAKVQVYSKWGTLVYSTDGLIINWDGRSNDGADLPAGTYYYILELDGGTQTQNGPISIVR